MKIFCLLINETREGEVFNPRIPIVSNDVRMAQAALKEFANDIKKELGDNWIIVADEEDWFEAYKRNNYSDNYILALIFNKNLDELNWSYE